MEPWRMSLKLWVESWGNKWWLFHQLLRAGSLCCWNERRHIQAMRGSLIPTAQRKPSDVCPTECTNLLCSPLCPASSASNLLPLLLPGERTPEASHCHTLWLTHCASPIGCYDGNTQLTQIFSKFLAKNAQNHSGWDHGNVRLILWRTEPTQICHKIVAMVFWHSLAEICFGCRLEEERNTHKKIL